MKLNMGGVDRGLRAVAGIALITWAAMGGPVWAWIGVVPLGTALIGFCPLYAPFGMSTCGKKAQSSEASEG